MKWQTDIGLEIHVQLNTLSKLFSGSSTQFGQEPNSAASFVDAGLPGTLPVLNSEAVHKALIFGLATSATINNYSYFERKNYFYPDLPKGYQITQNSRPIISGGFINILNAENIEKAITIHHAHLEEDAGKLIHDQKNFCTYIDLNRAGNPLLEIVTDPCINSASEAVTFLKEIHNLVKFLNISDGNMQEGSFRCDVNISVRPEAQPKLGTKTEIKNLNSFKFIEKAIEFEIERQINLLTNQQKISQETRLFCPESNQTYPMRGKEAAADYRYFMEPDLLPIEIKDNTLTTIKNNLPKLPQIIQKELQSLKINAENINFVLSSPHIYNLYNELLKLTSANSQQIINWLKGPYLSLLNTHNLSFSDTPINLKDLASLLDKVASNTISHQTAKTILPKLINNNKSLDEILKSVSNPSFNLEQIIQDVLAKNPKQVAEYKSGKEKILTFLIGQVMKISKGQADAQEVMQIIKTQLS